MFPLSPLPNCDKTSFFIQLPAKILLPSYAHIMHYILLISKLSEMLITYLLSIYDSQAYVDTSFVAEWATVNK